MILILVISFLLEGILSLYINQNSIFLPLFSIMSIFVIYPYIKEDRILIIYSVLMGIFYDIIYNQTLFLYTMIFLFIGFTIILFYKYFPINFFNTLIESILIIVIFRTLGYVSYVLTVNGTFNFNKLFEGIYKSLIINLLYVYIVSYRIKKHYNKSTKKYISK